MQIISRRIPAGALLLVLIQLAGGAFAQPQSPEQQRCITALNAGFAKVAKARSKTVVRCAKAAQKGDAFEACLADQQDKLDKALAKLASTETKKCSALPDFGPADLGALGDAGTQIADTALSDLLGLSLDGVIADKKQAKDTARCQLGVAKAAQKCALARVSAFNRCKKAGLKSGSIAGAADLAACLDDDAGGRLAKACTAKLGKAAARCSGVDLPAAFPACGASDATGLAVCADGRLACRARDALSAADGMDVPGCGAITPEAEVARAATEAIGPDGGEVMAVGGDGNVYRLSVPEGALLSEVAITITPVSTIPDLPFEGDLLAAVDFAPDGLQLWQGATLTIELPSAPDPGELTGFGWSGSGEALHLALVAPNGPTLTLGVSHFSGLGIALLANQASLAGLPPTTVEQQYLNQQPDPTADFAVYVAWLIAWFDDGVVPVIEAATASDPALETALAEMVAWRVQIDVVANFFGLDPDFVLGFDGFALAERVDAGLDLVAPALREAVIRNDVDCIVEEDLQFAEKALDWQDIAKVLSLDTEENGLDLGTVLDDFCVEVVYESISYPEFPQAGTTSPLVVSAGYSIDGGPTQFDLPLSSPVLATGTVEGANEMIIPAGDVGELGYTPTGDEELVISLNACLLTEETYPNLDGKICQPAVLVRGFRVTPEEAALEAGEEFDFDALLYGEPHPSVTWTATGGEITQDGIYTAGDEAGEFTVTATSNFTGLAETATVTIGEGPEPGVFEIVTFGAEASASDSGCNLGDEVLDRPQVGAEALPSVSLSASQSGIAGATGQLELHLEEDDDTGEITITASGQGTAFRGACPPESDREAAGGGGSTSAFLDFDFDPGETAYSFELTGSVDGSGDRHHVEVSLGPSGAPFAALCRINHDPPNAPPPPEQQFSCPGGASLSETGPLPAGLWRLRAQQVSAANVFTDPASESSFEFTLKLTPQ
ncbi:MAG: hypothetical protein OEP95_08530 [Myxococcales bacterium]|nr:hypothetical protein [Myxococcales bacterium]